MIRLALRKRSLKPRICHDTGDAKRRGGNGGIPGRYSAYLCYVGNTTDSSAVYSTTCYQFEGI